MRFIVYLITLLFMGTAIAQNPTILQGNYITNVFGQANFIRNPNAFTVGSSATNNPYVTVSSATVTRSTTTPLMAASEFTITTSSTTGFADWEARAFDAGMKYQICEARFTYRGFSTGTTTAQVISGASTVIASQVLIPSTDPRVVSMVFNCGDLSQTTKLRLQQATANLTGTNEIGGIYMGLATNMSTVAQATKVGGWDNILCSAEAQLTTGSGFLAPNTAGSCSGTPVGSASAALSNLNTLTFTFTGLTPGEYLLLMPAYVYQSVVANSRCDGRIRETTLNLLDSQNAFTYTNSTGGTTAIGQITQFKFTNTVTANRTFQIEFNRQSLSSSCIGGFINAQQNLSLYRFPTASEQVLTPNITSTWGGVSWTNAGTLFQSVSNNTYTSGNSTIFGNANATVYGPTATATGNTSEIKISNMPVGSFRIMYNGSLFANSAGSAINAECSVRIRETSTSITMAQNTWSGIASQTTDANLTNIEGVFRNASVGDRTFRVEVAMISPTTGIVAQRCGYLGATNTTVASGGIGVGQPTMIVQPLDYQLPLPIFIDQTPYTVTATSLTAPVAPYGRFEASGAGTTITLFGCSATTKGYNVEVKRVDASNNITVSRSGSYTIDGATTDLLAVNFQATQYVCNGSGGWRRF